MQLKMHRMADAVQAGGPLGSESTRAERSARLAPGAILAALSGNFVSEGMNHDRSRAALGALRDRARLPPVDHSEAAHNSRHGGGAGLSQAGRGGARAAGSRAHGSGIGAGRTA